MSKLTIKVTRWRGSLNYKRDASQPADWGNNDANNSCDTWQVFDDTGAEVFRSIVQTVSNMEGLDVPTAENPAVKFTNTIVPGPFQLKVGLDVLDPRAFYGRINGICNTKTMAGDVIGLNSHSDKDQARWLNHDWQKHKPNPAGVDCRVAWSAGCFIQPDAALAACGALYEEHGYKPGDLIDGELVEVD